MAVVFTLWNALTAGNILLLLLFLLMLNYLWELYEFRGMPPGPRLYTIPCLGNLLSFDAGAGKSLREKTQSLMRRYGKVFSVRMGSFKVVVVASSDSVKEVLVKRSGDYAGRPPFQSFSIISQGGKNILASNFGPSWKLHRKLFVTALRLYLKDANLVESRVHEQGKRILQFIENQEGKPFDPSSIFASSIANVISRITFGNIFKSSHADFDRLVEISDKIAKGENFIEGPTFWDLFPVGKKLPIRAYQNLQSLMNNVHRILRDQLREGEKAYNPEEPINSLIDALLKARSEETDKTETFLSENHLIGSIQDMFLAGSETATTTLRWAVAYLTNYPEYQRRVHKELDEMVGRDRFPRLDDRPNLPILQAFIMEVQRLSNIASESIPHYTLTDTKLCGYRVPKDTVVLVDLESVHLDPECWENPEEFNPYRHIDEKGNLVTDQGNWIPFSAGRRGCAGESLAKVELFLFLSLMLQRYSFVPEKAKEPPSLKGIVGFIVKKPQSYKVSAALRC